MQNNTNTSTTRTASVIVLAVVLAFCIGFGIFLSITTNSLAFAASDRYNLITDMPSNTSDGAAFTVDGTAVSGNVSSINKVISDGGEVVVRPNIVNINGVFGNFPLASLYYSSSASTNFVWVSSGVYTITQPGTYCFVTLVDCYDSAAHATVTKSYRSTYVLTINVKSTDLPVAPNKTGYTFTGWYTDEECTQLYEQDTITSDVTLYAGFRPNSYKIVFHGNDNTSGSMGDLAMTYDTAKNLTANAFAKTNYGFAGWATSASGTVMYTDEQSVKNLSTVDGATVDLYAVWEVSTFTIKFHGNLANVGGSMSDQFVTYGQATTLKANAFSKAGHNFIGWATSANGSVVYKDGAEITNLTSQDGQTIDLYAVWEVVRCKVTFMVDNEVLVIVTVDYGTPTEEVVGKAVNPTLYTVTGELPN